MTAQIPDSVHYKDMTYNVIGIKGEGLPKPSDYGLHPAMWHTACYRGYVAGYLCTDEGLFLDKLHIGCVSGKWVAINGIEPETQYSTGWSMNDGEKEEVTWENGKLYQGLNLETYFSGGILIATGFIRELYVHMGYGKPYQYEHVHELLFHEGTLTQEIDHSEKAAAWRERILQHRKGEEGLTAREINDQRRDNPLSKSDLEKEIEWRFSLDYGNWF